MSLKVIADAADVVAGVVVVGALTKWLPPIAASLSIIWLVIRIYEHFRWVSKGRPPRT